MAGINAESYREELERILENYGLGPESLEFVDSFPEPLKSSKCIKISRKITLKKVITPEEKEAALAELFKFPDEVKGLEDEWAFLKHTLMRHICSIQQRWQPEYECAKWAFYNMKRI